MKSAQIALALVVSGIVAVVAPGDVRAIAEGGSSGSAPGDAGFRGAGSVDVAQVGPTAVTGSALRARLAAMPPFQRGLYGDSPDAIRRNVLLDVVVRDALLSLAAQKAGVDRTPAVVFAVRRALAASVVQAVRAGLGGPAAIPTDRVRAYYDAHRDRYESPPQIQIWRILCRTEAEAQSVLDACRRNPTPQAFADLAREHSEDKATYLRSGNLGFVAPDGASSFADFRVDPALVQAATAVRDGELVPAPVAEGQGFAVVWRRGTIAAVHKSVDDVAGGIRSLLYEEAVREETERRVAALRAARVRGVDEALLDALPEDHRLDAD